MDNSEPIDFSWILDDIHLDLANLNFARNFGYLASISQSWKSSQLFELFGPREEPSRGLFKGAVPSWSSPRAGGGFANSKESPSKSRGSMTTLPEAANNSGFNFLGSSTSSSGSSEEGSMDIMLKKPWGICASHSNVFVADRDNHQVSILSGVDLRLIRKFGTHGHGPTDLFRPTGVAFDPLRNRILITDKDNHRVSFYTTEGTWISSFGRRGHGEQEFNYPWGVAVSPHGQIAVADSKNNRVQLFDYRGGFLASHSAITTNVYKYKVMFNNPRSVTFDNNGLNLYVVDFNLETAFQIPMADFNTRIRLFPPKVLSRPQGIAIHASSGNILVCDGNNCMVKMVTPGGNPVGYMPTWLDQKPVKPMDITTFRDGVIVIGAEGQIIPLNIN